MLSGESQLISLLVIGNLMKHLRISCSLLFLLLPLSLFADKSPLFLAVDAQDLAKVKQEIVNVHDLEERSEAGHTLLMVAAGWEGEGKRGVR